MMEEPYFLVIGGNKCGTSWLYEMLREHSELNLSTNKEPHFFSKNYEKDYKWYFSNWSDKEKGKKGECSTSYLYSELAIERIRSELPDIKLIILLREPLERAISHLQHEGRKKKLVSEELLKEHPEIISNSLYSDKLERIYERFPAQNVLLLYHEEVKDDPSSALNRVYDFLQVPKEYPENLNEVIGKGFRPASTLLERFRIFLYFSFKKLGFYRGIRWFKNLGLSRLYRNLNSRGNKGADHRNFLLGHQEKFEKDLKKTLELEELNERDRGMIRKWLGSEY